MPTRPAFRPAILGAVVLGGTLGVALRELLLLPFTALSDQSTLALPLATMAVNVVGSFALGAVAGRLGTRHPLGRAFLGTGILGGFTTYSAFAVQSVTVFSAAPLVGIFLAVLSVLLGLAAAALGVRLTLRPLDGADETPSGSGVTS
ncbi:MAG: CrcB family protein [Microbacterium sp.]